jgi:NADPH:quinone reductase-like Zn-dependent oxidoreductase
VYRTKYQLQKELKKMQTDIASLQTEQVATRAMRAVVQHRYGSPDMLTNAMIQRPEIASDEVLIDVAAAGVDRGVWHLLTGRPYLVRLAGYGIFKPKNPVPGLDVSGRVVAVGDDVRRFHIGDEVFGIASGAYAELAAAKEEKLAHKPSNISYEEAAVAAISGITALQALTDVGRVQAGESALVIGASGGVGTYAIQLAKALGVTVTGVASVAKADLVSSLGADHVIDYKAEDYLDGQDQYDLIIDIGGLNSVSRLRRALKPGGTLVIVGGEGGGSITGGIGRQMRAKMLSPFVSQRLTFLISTEHYSYMERLARFMEEGEVTPAVRRRYGLDEVAEAIADLEAGRTWGKSVIVMGESS